MDQAARVAFVYSQTVCALAKIEAMKAENRMRELNGQALAYGEQAFLSVPDEYQIGWNSVVSYLRDG